MSEEDYLRHWIKKYLIYYLEYSCIEASCKDKRNGKTKMKKEWNE
jgi:hypothetical protein